MLIDTGVHGEDTLGLEAALEADICIVGGGVAGLLLAERLGQQCRVTLLEAGGLQPDLEEGSDPFGAVLAGTPHAGSRQGRIRAFGGCSLNWGGQLLSLPSDVTWAIPTAELQAAGSPWGTQVETLDLLREEHLPVPGSLARLPGFTSRLSRFLPFRSRSLVRKPGQALIRSRHVNVVPDAFVTSVIAAANGDHVTAVQVLAGDGKQLLVRASQFILAAGTVETCRLLLASRLGAQEGIGNRYGQLGRNFHDHLTVSAAEFTGPARAKVLGELRPWFLKNKSHGRSMHSLKLEPTAELRETLGLHRAMVHITIEEPSDSALATLRDMMRRRQQQQKVSLGSDLKHLPKALLQVFRVVWEASVRRRRYVSSRATVRLQLNIAQDSPSASTISLSSATDLQGLPKALVNWHISAAELASLRKLAACLKQQLAAAGIREGVEWEPSLFHDSPQDDQQLLAALDDARHAMGGACMGTDPRTSVVDSDLRVHGLRNLWIASPAVFPDGAPQLPTYTLGALCIRLAARVLREVACV